LVGGPPDGGAPSHGTAGTVVNPALFMTTTNTPVPRILEISAEKLSSDTEALLRAK